MLTGDTLNANEGRVELNEREMEIIENNEICIDKNSSDEDRTRYDARLKGVQGL